MGGVRVPITVEAPRQPGLAATLQAVQRRRSNADAVVRKPLKKKSSRQRLKTFNVEIQCEAPASKEIKNAISRRQSSKDLKNVMIRRQSSKDLRRPSGARITIRRDSVNGLRIVTNTDTEDNDAIDKLGEISLTDHTAEFTRFQQDALKAHNLHRARHAAPPLSLSAELSEAAGDYARQLARSDQFSHSGDERCGENLYWSWSSDPAWVCGGEEAVSSWYEESRGYNYRAEPRDTQSGHFTQLVWQESQQVGVGVHQSANTGKYYVVMKYFPPGNVLGQYTDNVKPPPQ